MMADPYARCAGLTRDQWAWEFLRRNPDYRRDYRAFIAIWRALEADYGGAFAAMVWRDKLFATQFHPEKSQAIGLQFLKNFIGL